MSEPTNQAPIPERWKAAWDTLPQNCLERVMIKEIAALTEENERVKAELKLYKPTSSIEIGGTHGH